MISSILDLRLDIPDKHTMLYNVQQFRLVSSLLAVKVVFRATILTCFMLLSRFGEEELYFLSLSKKYLNSISRLTR
jgi:hypothetical protein